MTHDIKTIFLIGQCTLHLGRMEFGNIGNYYIIEPLIRELYRAFPNSVIKTTFQMSDSFCNREKVSILPMEIYYDPSKDNLNQARTELQLVEKHNFDKEPATITPFIQEVLSSDLIIDYSGDIWGDNANLLGPDRFEVGLCKDRVAQLLGKRTAMIAGSPGPISNTRLLPLAQEVYKNFNLVTNRECVSTSLLRESGFDVSKTVDAACPAFLFDAQPDQTSKRVISELHQQSSRRPLIGVIICGWNFSLGPFDRPSRNDAEFNVFSDAVEFLTSEFGAYVVLMSHSNGFHPPPAPFLLIRGRDYPLAKQLHEILQLRGHADNVTCLEEILTPQQTKAVIGEFDMLISGRIHGAVAGISQGVPTVILDYGHEPKAHKLIGFAKIAQIEHFIANPVNINDLLDIICQCWVDRQQVRLNLLRRMKKVEYLAHKNFDILASVFH